MPKDTSGDSQEPFRILSLSGGGYLGYYTAAVLQALEERAGTPLCARFDLVAGTSIGGILALSVAAGVPAADIAESFRRHGRHVFSDRPKPAGWISGMRNLVRGLFSPRYSAGALRTHLEALLGDRTLGDVKRPVMITAVDAADGSARLFSSLREEDRGLRAVDVAMATAAVPTFYPLARVGNGLFADGGLFANAPDVIVASECEHVLGVAPARMQMVSIGTTSTQFSLPRLRRIDMGALEWLMEERMVRLTIAGQQSSTETLMRRMLGPRYLRIDATQTVEEQDVLGLDVATREAQDILLRLAASSLKSVDSDQLLRSILSRPH